MKHKNFLTALGAGLLGASIVLVASIITFSHFGALKGATAQVYAQEKPANVLSSDEQNLLENYQSSFNKIADRVLPSIVRVDVVTIQKVQQRDRSLGIPWSFFFNDDQESEGQEREYRSGSLGSGFVVEREGDIIYMLTNFHVVDKANQISVQFYDGTTFDAELLGVDERKDLAMIKADVGSNHPDILPVALSNSDDVRVGDIVFAFGSPFGFDFSVTSGIVSAIGRTGGPTDNINDFIQTDTAINQGNSGGPLINIRGEVVGVNDWIATQSGGSIGLGFSIPVNNAKVALEALKAGETPEYGWLGVSISEISRLGGKEYAESAGFEQTQGALIIGVYSNGPAEKGGLRPGDLVISINDEIVKDSRRLTYLVGSVAPDQTIKVGIIRDGAEKALDIKIEKRADEQTTNEEAKSIWPNMLVLPLNKNLRQDLNINDKVEGVVVGSVTARTTLAIAGLKQGDLITAINGQAVKSLRDFYRYLNDDSAKGKYKFEYLRNGQKLNIGIERS